MEKLETPFRIQTNTSTAARFLEFIQLMEDNPGQPLRFGLGFSVEDKEAAVVISAGDKTIPFTVSETRRLMQYFVEAKAETKTGEAASQFIDGLIEYLRQSADKAEEMLGSMLNQAKQSH